MHVAFRWRTGCAGAAAALMLTTAASAADLKPMPVKASALAAPAPWAVEVSPYFWMPWLNGSSTVKGHTTDIDATFEDLLHRKIPKELFGLMTSFEARKDRVAVIGDFVYMLLGVDKSAARSVTLGPVATLGVDAALDMTVKMVVTELALAYEVGRWRSGIGGPGANTALDVYGGGRLWWQQVDVNLALTAQLALVLPRRHFTISGGRAIAGSGDVTWIDPVVGMRLRHQFAPGHDLTLSGDVGGFGVGSQFSWQAVGLYRFALAQSGSVMWSGLLGYRALYVDYAKGSGDTLYAYDMLQHGPVLGVSMRF